MISGHPKLTKSSSTPLISLYLSLHVTSYHQSYQSLISPIFLSLSRHIHSLVFKNHFLFHIITKHAYLQDSQLTKNISCLSRTNFWTDCNNVTVLQLKLKTGNDTQSIIPQINKPYIFLFNFYAFQSKIPKLSTN